MYTAEESLLVPWLPTVLTLALTVSLVVTVLWCGMCNALVQAFSKEYSQPKAPKADFNRIRAIGKMPQKFARDLFRTKPVPTQVSSVRKKAASVKKNYENIDDDQDRAEDCFGWIKFHVAYNESARRLKVNILNALSLPVRDIMGSSDPFCLVILYPTKEKRCTNTISKNLNPVWKETLVFPIDKEALLEQTMYLFVLDKDWLTKDDLIGETSLSFMDEDEILSGSGQMYWHQLEPSIGPVGDYGEVEMALKFDPDQGQLTINVLRARNLQAMDDITKSSDPYVKVDLLHNDKRVGKFKTTVVKNDLNPSFHQKVTFKISLKQLKKSCLMVTVKDQDFVGSNDVIGCVMLGSRGGARERGHWDAMMNGDGKETQPRWHPLRRE